MFPNCYLIEPEKIESLNSQAFSSEVVIFRINKKNREAAPFWS
jgi:hypothetical protein